MHPADREPERDNRYSASSQRHRLCDGILDGDIAIDAGTEHRTRPLQRAAAAADEEHEGVVLLILGFLLASVTTVVHAVCTTLTLLLLESRWIAPRATRSMVSKGLVVMLVVNVLFVVSLLECALWAAAYLGLGALGSWSEAYYFSATTFTTTGYGDVVLSPAWRSMGNFEAVIGIIMFGWSTALLVTVVTHLRRSRYVEPVP